jgi:hypothetical protein
MGRTDVARMRASEGIREKVTLIELPLSVTLGIVCNVANADLDMDKEEISRKVDAIVVSRLFGKGSWLADRETSVALQRMLLV